MRGRAASPPLGRGPLALLGDGILLFLALWGTAATLVTAFDLTLLSRALPLGCGVCALVFLLAFSLPRRYGLLVLCPVGAVWALALWRLWDVLVLGEVQLRCGVVNAFVTWLGRGTYIEPVAQLTPHGWAAALTALVLAALVPLAWVLALAAVYLRSFWAVLCLTLPFAIIPWCTVGAGWLPAMALALCWCAMALTRLAARQGRRGTAKITLALLPALALLLGLITLITPAQRPQWAVAAQGRITDWFSGLNLSAAPEGELLQGESTVDLSQAGPLRFSGRTALRVETDLRGRIYLRGFSGAVYDGASWAPLAEEAYAGLEPFAIAGTAQGDEAAQGLLRGYQPMNYPALADRAAFPGKGYAACTVENLGADPAYVYFPYYILSQPDELKGAAFVHDGSMAREQGVDTHTLYIQPGCSPDSGARLTGEAAVSQRVYESFVYAAYLDVPAQSRQAVEQTIWQLDEEIFSALSGDGSPAYIQDYLQAAQTHDGTWTGENAFYLALARLVGDYLGDIARYDPDTPAVPEGEDFVSYFLTQSRQGYCMHFASAAVLILRQLGVPARYVSGYVADIPASGRADVPDSNAHAWVEIYLSGYGWEPVEVTPAYGDGQPTVQPSVSPTPSAPQETAVQALPTPSASQAQPTPSPEAWDSPAEADIPLWLLIPAAAVLALAVLALRRYLARRGRLARMKGDDPHRGVIAAYRYLTRLERWGGQMPPPVLQAAQKASFSPHPITRPEQEAACAAALEQAGTVDAALSPLRRLIFRYLAALY